MKRQVVLYVLIALVFVSLLFLLKWCSHARFQSLYAGALPKPYDPYERFANPPIDAGPYINVYTSTNGQGNMTTFTSGVSNVSSTNLNGSIMSFDIGPHTRATFFSGINQGGKTVVYENKQDMLLQVPNFQEDYMVGNALSFKLEIIEPYMIAYSGQNLGGASKIFSGSVPLLTKEWNNQIQSFSVSPFTKVTLFSGAGFDPSGTQKEYSNPTETVRNVLYVGSAWQTQVSSLKIEALFNNSSITSSGGASGIIGRYVQLRAPSVGCMNIAEIQVYSTDGTTNIAAGKNVSMSSGYQTAGQGVFPGFNLVDGNLSNFAHTSCADTPWMLIDLGSVVPITEIVVYNRADCCSGRIAGSVLSILDVSETIIWTSDVFTNQSGLVTNQNDTSGYATYTVRPPSTKVLGK